MCAACTAVTQSLVAVLHDAVEDLAGASCLELSGRGTLAAWLTKRAGQLMCTEYMPDQPTGNVVNGVRNEDVQALTFASDSFDLCTSTEVFEHVQDDAAGFGEVLRVLKPGGIFVFTVPLTGAAHTLERAKVEAGTLVHLLPPEYHADPFSGSEQVLAFRNYGKDITERLLQAGFKDAKIVPPAHRMFGYARPVLLARKAANLQVGGERSEPQQ